MKGSYYSESNPEGYCLKYYSRPAKTRNEKLVNPVAENPRERDQPDFYAQMPQARSSTKGYDPATPRKNENARKRRDEEKEEDGKE